MGRIRHEEIHEEIHDLVMACSRVWEIFEIGFVSDMQVQTIARSKIVIVIGHDNQARS